MAKKKKCPECPAGERWAVPYADFLSLLLALFIALYAISSQNKDKLKALSKSFSEIFEFTPASTVPVSISQDPSQAGSQQATVSQKEDAKQSQSSREQQIESVRQLMKELQSVKDVAIENGNGSDTEVVMTEEGIRIRMLNAIIFEEGSAEMSQASNKMLDILANQKHQVKKVVIASSRSIYGEGKYIHPELGAVYPKHREEADMLAGDFEVKYNGFERIV